MRQEEHEERCGAKRGFIVRDVLDGIAGAGPGTQRPRETNEIQGKKVSFRAIMN